MDTGLDALNTASKTVVNKTVEVLGNKAADAVTNSHDDKIVETKPVEEITIPPEKKRKCIKWIKINITKIEHYEISKLLNDSTVSKFITKTWIEVNDLSSGQYSVNKNIRFKTPMLITDLCDYSDAYIVVKGTIAVKKNNDTKNKKQKAHLER